MKINWKVALLEYVLIFITFSIAASVTGNYDITFWNIMLCVLIALFWGHTLRCFGYNAIELHIEDTPDEDES